MDNVVFRDARPEDAALIVQMIRYMVTDMAAYGGHPPAGEDLAWEKMQAAIADELKGSGARFMIAEAAEGASVGVAGAQQVTLDGAFAPRRVWHISVVYVLPQFRRAGIGGQLLARILDCGRAAGIEQCDLNVLAGNPAKSLYEKHGFSVLEVRMVRSL